ncbi:MAG TPA: AAA family ATPase, partial [Acidimicrobiia bacterium]
EVVRSAPNEIADRETWLAVGHALHFETCGTDYEDEARDVWIDWCLRWEARGVDRAQLRADAVKMWDNALPPEEVLAAGKTPMRGGTILHHLRPRAVAPEPPVGGLFRKFDAKRDMALRPWIIENMLREGELGGVSGGPGTGKTNVTATWIAGMLAGNGPAAGLPTVARPLNVAWVNAEEDVNALDLRVLNALKELGLVAKGQLHTAGQETLIGEEFDGTSLVCKVNRDSVINLDLVAKYISELKAQGADILILDPVTEFNDGEENDRGDTKKLFRAMKTMAREAGLTVLYFAHTAQTPEGKLEDWYRGNLYAQRGSSAAIGALQFGATLTPMYPPGLDKARARQWREQQADAADDRVPNIVEMLTIKSKMGTTKPKLYYEIRQSTTPTADGQRLPFAEPLTSELAYLKIEGAKDSNQDMVKADTALGIVKRLGEGVHHNATKLHAQMRGVPGWPDVEKLDLSKGAGAELLKTWMRATQVTVNDVVYRVSISRKDSGPMEERFRIVVGSVT